MPQWRMLLARTGEASYQLIWSAHHAILDGWSISLILNDAVKWYGALTEGRHIEMAPTRPYRDYVSWLEHQDMEQAESYWRETLKGVEQATPLSVGNATDAGGRHRRSKRAPARPLSSSVRRTPVDFRSWRSTHRLTLNTVLQGCWALLLGRYAGTDDVVFGTVVSGRPSEVEGVERMVGLFINTLPLRVQVPASSSSLEWLHGLQEQNVQMRQYDYSPLSHIQRWSELPSGAPLFDTLFVFENYPVEKDDAAALRFDMTRSEERSNYSLSLVATVPDRLRISVQYDTGRFEQEAVDRMLGHLRSICSQVAREPGVRLSEITVLTEEERQQILQQGNPAPGETVVGADFDLSAFAAGITTPEERELLEQLVAEVQGMSPSDLQDHVLNAPPATETSENHE